MLFLQEFSQYDLSVDDSREGCGLEYQLDGHFRTLCLLYIECTKFLVEYNLLIVLAFHYC